MADTTHDFYQPPTAKHPHGVYRPPLSRAQQFWRVMTATAITAVVVLGGWQAVTTWDVLDNYCDTDLGIQRMSDGECVGASDGRYVFDDAYDEVLGMIAEQNREADRVREVNPERQYATIAVWIPHPTEANAPNDTDEVRHQLEGTLLAQQSANLEPDPPIKLLVANGGTGNQHWEAMCADLERRKTTDNLVAVTGLGSSYRTTEKAINCLDAAEIPMIGSVMTADNIVDKQPYAYRVAPSNSDEGFAATAYLHSDPDVKVGMKISSLDADDTYSATLSRAFNGFEAKGRKLKHNQSFDPSKPGLKAQFADISNNVCYYRPDVLLYAGRGREHLELLVEALGSSNCASEGYEPRIVTGDDASLIRNKDRVGALLRDGRVMIEYAALVHASQWSINSAVSGIHSGPMSAFVKRHDETFSGPVSEGLADGHAIMAFDAMNVIVRVTTERGLSPSAAAVASGLQQVRDCSAVNGLSGLIEFMQDGDVTNKAVPILQAGSSTKNPVKAVSWPEGKPTKPAGSC